MRDVLVPMDESPLILELRRAVDQLGLAGQSVLVGVSGGADSVALLRGLCELAAEWRLRLVAGHLNHRLRGVAADADAEWVADLCGRLEVPALVGRVDVQAAAAAHGTGLEEAARQERYRFFEQAARESNCPYIAVAHTADDQAETILHHVLRGSGLAGLSGMPVTRPLAPGLAVVRPLLCSTRGDVLDYLGHRGQPFREDETNVDETFTRNRLRRTLLPQLARDYNPQLRETLCRMGRAAGEAQAALADCAEGWLERTLLSADARECRLKWQPLSGRPRHLVREVLAGLWRRQSWPRQRMSFEHWERLADVLLAGGACDLPGHLHAERDGRLLLVTCTPPRPAG